MHHKSWTSVQWQLLWKHNYIEINGKIRIHQQYGLIKDMIGLQSLFNVASSWKNNLWSKKKKIKWVTPPLITMITFFFRFGRCPTLC